MPDSNRHDSDIGQYGIKAPRPESGDFVFDKSIFKNVFYRDIQKVYIYKKAERLAKAIQLISPAFSGNAALKERSDRIAIGLIDAAVGTTPFGKDALARELLALSSVLSLAKAGNMLSPMNADFIAKEARSFLEEVAGYEEPRVSLDEVPTVAALARASVLHAPKERRSEPRRSIEKSGTLSVPGTDAMGDKGHEKDIKDTNVSRREAILSVIKERGDVYIKDISMMLREVSEKTIQRELSALVIEGVLQKSGERRWTRYALARS